MRDMFLTGRSFAKRLTAFLRYRRATHDMNERYPDATVEEIQREDTCIICREEMTPWSVTNPPEPPVAANGPGQPPAGRPRAPRVVNERTRPKKLPCGHVLHLGCLKSWLERQQVCPTCRRPVVDNTTPPVGRAARAGQAAGVGAPGQPQLPGEAPPNQGAGPGAQPNAPRMRMINFGPIRLGFGQAPMPIVNGQPFGAPAPAQQNGAPGGPRVYGVQFGFPRIQPPQADAAAPATSTSAIHAQLHVMEQQIMDEIRDLQVTQQELSIVQLLQAELSRLRSMQGTTTIQPGGSAPHMQQIPRPNLMPFPTSQNPVTSMQRHEAPPGIAAVPSGHPDLPPGVIIPEGWTLLPLQRTDRQAPSDNHGVQSNSDVAVSEQPAGLQPTPTVTSLPQTSVLAGSSSTAAPQSDNIIPINSSNVTHAEAPTSTLDQVNSQSAVTPSNSLERSDVQTLQSLHAPATPPSNEIVPNPASESWSWDEPPSPVDSVGIEPQSGATHPAATSDAANSSNNTETNESGEMRRDKGKAKATSVEDVLDEDA